MAGRTTPPAVAQPRLAPEAAACPGPGSKAARARPGAEAAGPPRPDPGAAAPAAGPAEPGALAATARLLWQQGDWAGLLALLPADPGASPDRAALLALRLQAAFLCGEPEAGRAALAALRQEGAGRGAQQAALLAGAFSALARGWLVLGEPDRARAMAREAAALQPGGADPDRVADLRMAAERGRALAEGRLLPGTARRARGLFIDCGGYDGCSALSFLLAHPDYDCVTFEPNPELWKHYDDLPTELVRKAAWIEEAEIAFTLDPVDGDGSTLMAGKRIDATGQMADAACPVLTVPCVDLSAFVRRMAERYDHLVLKLDVEGAEYDILEKMLQDGTLACLDRLHCEFHVRKMEMDPARHDRILAAVQAEVAVRDWDALPLSVIAADSDKLRLQRRALLLQTLRHIQLHFSERSLS